MHRTFEGKALLASLVTCMLLVMLIDGIGMGTTCSGGLVNYSHFMWAAIGDRQDGSRTRTEVGALDSRYGAQLF